MGVQSVWCRNLFSKAGARTEETFGEPVPFVPSPPVLRARSQIRPCHLAGHSRKTNPSRFRGRLHFREKPLAFGPRTLRGMNGVGWVLTEPRPGQAEGGIHPQPVSSPCSPQEAAQWDWKYSVLGKSKHLLGAPMKAPAHWDQFPVLSPKYPFTSMLGACHKTPVICWDVGQGLTP